MRDGKTLTWLAMLALLYLAAAPGCSNGSGGGPVGPVPLGAGFAPSVTPGSPDRVRLVGRTSGDLVSVDIVIAGATTSDDLYSFAFDLTVDDPTVAEYVDGSAEFGTALELAAGQQGEVLASSNGGRITVGVSKLGGGPGNGVAGGEPAVATLTFRILRRDTTRLRIAALPPPAALDSTGTGIGSVSFDVEPATLWGS